MSAPAETPALPRTDRREYEMHQVLAHNRDHWEGQLTDRWGEPVDKHSGRTLRELQEHELIQFVPGPVDDHLYVRLTMAGHALLAEWSRPRGRWSR